MSKVSVILKEDVEKLGHAGDLVQVSRGFARNYLIPRSIGIEADSQNMALVEQQKARVKERAEKLRTSLQELSQRLASIELSLPVKVGENQKMFGSITAHDIVESLSGLGISLDKKQIHLEKPIREIGTFEVEIRLSEGIRTKTVLNIHPE
ncbi:MAG: 50S ribosomal protein L9 [Leptospirales bacterium]